MALDETYPPSPYPRAEEAMEHVSATLMSIVPPMHQAKIGATLGTNVSCGVTFYWHLNSSNDSPERQVAKILKERSTSDKKIREAFVIFSDTAGVNAGGSKLYRYIKENKLGNVMEFGPRMNPNTGNMIKLWVWEPPHESLLPSNRNMPIHGKKLWKDSAGYDHYLEPNDSRLLDTRFADRRSREA